MFASRIASDLAPNRLADVLRHRRSTGDCLIDLTESNPTRVGLLMDIPDMDAVMAAMQTPEAAAAMEHDGVLPETLVILVEA